ncbi:MAG: hypothetical protein CMD16_03215 [Flavobacteriales bacterium]|nr:hypothetical protein [Flavobacteriales bacterium]
MKNLTQHLFDKLNEFIKKYYHNQLIKGCIYVLSILLIFFILFSVIEYFYTMDVRGRTFLFWTYIVINFIVFCKYITFPLLRLFSFKDRLTHKQASKIIGDHFSNINDKLINILELHDLSNDQNELVLASIEQKTSSINAVPFKNAIDFKGNKQHLKWILTPIIILFLFFISGKEYMLTESSARIVKHNTFFEPKAPFNYVFLNKNLNCKQFDNFLLKIRITGNEIPNEIFIQSENNKFKLEELGNNEFQYKFKRINSDIIFNFFAGGYSSKPYTIKSLAQPKVVDMRIVISHPKYTGKIIEKKSNNGDIIASEGSSINWKIQLQNTDSCSFIYNGEIVQETSDLKLEFSKKVLRSSNYSIISSNENKLTDTLTYYITVIADKFPKIDLVQRYDSSNTQFIFEGNIEDDYLLRKLEFIYSIKQNDSIINYYENVKIEKNKKQRFFYTFNFENLNIDPEKELKYYFKIWDNDAINGSKFTKSNTFIYKQPNIEEIIKRQDIENKKIKSGLNKSILLAEEIQKKIEELNKSILKKKKIGWEEKKKAADIIKLQKELEKKIANTQKKNSENLKATEKLNSSVLEKQKKLEELMNNLIDDEIKKLIQEMEQMMDESNKEKLQNLLEQIKLSNTDLEKELDRELELFKQFEFEQKVEETLDKLAKLKKEQEGLKKETTAEQLTKEELVKAQENLSQEMDKIKKDLNDLRKKNMDLEDKNKLPNTQKIETTIQQKMQESKNNLEIGKKKKSEKSQKDAIEKIEELTKKLESMKQASEEEKPKEDMHNLRKILENLVTVSFNQEELMAHVNNTPRNSSEFVRIVQEQNKLSADSKIIEDSLFALSKRVVQIQGAINKEITSIKSNMQKATKKLEDRDVNKATERQQFVMTSVNNLALLLSEILEQMQKELDSPPSDCNKPKNCNKPNPNCKKPSMSELKKAQKKLNEKMNKGKGKKKGQGEKKGEKKSKELIKLAREQEQIRKQLMELRDNIGENGEKGKLDKILEDMEENERDIINNKITQETINRQSEILTRLLEAENAEREQEEDNKRQATEWKFEPDNITDEYIEYKKLKKEQEELLKTTPVQLTPFYKEKVTNYFNHIIND